MIIKVDSTTSVVFDLDDTLYKEIGYLQSAYMSIAKHIEPDKWEFLFANMFALYREGKDVFGTLEENYNIEKQALVKQYREHQPAIKLENGAYDLMNKIKNKNGKLGILTDGRTNTQINKIRSLGIIDFFDIIGISESLGTEKPNKNNYEFIEQKLKTESYYYIGDNFKKDFITPNTMGWTTIGLMDNGQNIHNTAHLKLKKQHSPQILVRCLSDIYVC